MPSATRISDGLAKLELQDNQEFAYTELELKGEGMPTIDNTILNYVNLKYLDLSHNDLTDFQGVSMLPRLQSLNVQYNKINSLKGGERLAYLSIIQADNNHIASLETLKHPTLKAITLKNNRIESLQGLEVKKSNLQVLDVSHNRVNSLEGIHQLNNLCILNARGNALKDLPEGVGDLKQLKQLDVRENQINNIFLLSPLKSCVQLETLMLSGNPIDVEGGEEGLVLELLILFGFPLCLSRVNTTILTPAHMQSAKDLHAQRLAEAEAARLEREAEAAAAAAEAAEED